MCEYCYADAPIPNKRYIDETSGLLVVPMTSFEDAMERPPAIEGWEPLLLDDYSGGMYGGVEYVCRVHYRRIQPLFFISLYRTYQGYGGPEEGGWWYYSEELIETVHRVQTSDRKEAQRIARSLNRLKSRQEDEHRHSWADRYPRDHYAIEEFPGEEDTSNDPRPHYC